MNHRNLVLAVFGLLFGALALLAGPAAADGTGWADHQQRLQSDRVLALRAQGQVSPYELYSLSSGQARIDSYRQSVRRDGQLDLVERARLGTMLDRQRRAIYNLSND